MHKEDFCKYCANNLDDIEYFEQFEDFSNIFYDLIYNSDYYDDYV
jgi:hypothetical protein